MTQRELEDLFWRATILCLGLDPDDPGEAVQKRVRVSWPQSDTGNSTWGRDEDVVFLRIAPTPDGYEELDDVTTEYDAQTNEAKQRVRYHRSFSITWICYGPGSLEDADTIRTGVKTDAIRHYLNGFGVAVQPHIQSPVRLTEPDESGDWWERCDLTARFYALTERTYTVGEIDSVSIGPIVQTGGSDGTAILSDEKETILSDEHYAIIQTNREV